MRRPKLQSVPPCVCDHVSGSMLPCELTKPHIISRDVTYNTAPAILFSDGKWSYYFWLSLLYDADKYATCQCWAYPLGQYSVEPHFEPYCYKFCDITGSERAGSMYHIKAGMRLKKKYCANMNDDGCPMRVPHAFLKYLYLPITAPWILRNLQRQEQLPQMIHIEVNQRSSLLALDPSISHAAYMQAWRRVRRLQKPYHVSVGRT